MRRGGTGPAKEATEDVQQVCNQVKDQVEKFLEKRFAQFKAMSYRPQTVAGVNYFVKVRAIYLPTAALTHLLCCVVLQVDVGEGAYLHVRIYKNLQGEVTLSGVQQDKMELEEIAYFEKHIDWSHKLYKHWKLLFDSIGMNLKLNIILPLFSINKIFNILIQFVQITFQNLDPHY